MRRLSLARHLYQLGISSLRSSSDLHLFSAANLLQDAVEAFLIAVADYVGAATDQNTKFDKLFIVINEKIAPKELPFKSKLLRLNRVRVDSKHYGIQPARDECERLAVAVREFFDEVSSSILEVTFTTVSAIDLLQDGDTKVILLDAKTALETGKLEDCAINCRKALFLEVERDYDISEFKDSKLQGLLGGLLSRAPFYTKSKEYIEKNVRDPTDYVVYDHSDLNQELLTQGVDNTSFWNVWRLTPEVFRTREGTWVVKHDFDKLEESLLADKIEYIFSTTVDIVLAIHTTRKAIRTSSYGRFYIDLKQETVPVYEKADTTSTVIATTPPGMLRVDTDFRILGLQGDGPFWHVHHFEESALFSGYIHNDFVKVDG